MRELMSGSQLIGREFFQTVVNKEGTLAESSTRLARFEYSIYIFGDEFRISVDSNGWCIYHPTWTLMGEGKTLDDAKRDLLLTIREVRKDLIHSPLTKLAPSAIAFREYLVTRLNV